MGVTDPPDPRDVRLRQLPSVERVLSQLEGSGRLDGIPRPLAARFVRQALETARSRLLKEARSGLIEGTAPAGWAPEQVLADSARLLAWYGHPSLVRAVNATGILIHTNLGRAPLSAAAQEAVRAALTGYTFLEIDPETGDRGSRQAHVETLLEEISGAEAALAVNNNAAAVLLGLAALAAGREVIVSRGELVEIGGSFRMPEVMAQSGARLVEVGTTNRTHLADYERALTPQTALVLKVHRSNFAMSGFVHEVPVPELVALAAGRSIPVMYDLGSGALVDLAERGLPREPTVQDAVTAGAALVTFSGDKLAGGPQAGLLVGTKEAVSRCRGHPLARALRIDRLDLAALAATLRHYLTPGEAWAQIPILQMLAAGPEELEARAQRLADRLRERLGEGAEVAVVGAEAQVGGGALPEAALSSSAVRVRPRRAGAEAWAAQLRQARPPVIARIQDEALLLNLRTLSPDDVEAVVAAFSALR